MVAAKGQMNAGELNPAQRALTVSPSKAQRSSRPPIDRQRTDDHGQDDDHGRLVDHDRHENPNEEVAR
jgi:hypothetical protein